MDDRNTATSNARSMAKRLDDAYGNAAVEAARDAVYGNPAVKKFLYGDENIVGLTLEQIADKKFLMRMISLSSIFDCAADPAPPEGPGATQELFLELFLKRHEQFEVSESHMMDVVDVIDEQVTKLKQGGYKLVLQ